MPAVFSGVALAVALRKLPVLHPVVIWAGSWTFTTVLYALKLLPYRSLSWLTAALVCGTVVAFAAGAPLGVRLARKHPVRGLARAQADVIQLAALAALALLLVALAAFFAQLVSRYGISRVVRISPEVKQYLSGGEAPLSSAYVEVAIASAALCALRAALADSRRVRRQWLALTAISAGTVYFSTSRAFIAVALVAGLAAFALTTRNVNRARLSIVAVGVVVVILASFIGLGSLLGKTYRNSTIGEFDNFFSRHPAVSWLALPYQDATASVPALDVMVGATSTWGVAHGCATAPIVCGAMRKLGVATLRVPVAGPFTKAPLRWNGYTFLDRFLIDGGTALVLVLVVLTGALAGFLWHFARAGSALGIVAYGIAIPALIGAYRGNLVELVGLAIILAVCLLLAARWILGWAGNVRKAFASSPA